MINHGTRGGYYKHRRLSEEPCESCREAINEYVRDYRSRPGNERDRTRERIRRRALAELRERHREEFDNIFTEIMADELDEDDLL